MTAATGLWLTLAGGNTRTFIETLVFALAFGIVGYRISARHRAVRGVTPWRLPSVVWGLICFLFWLLGVLVEYLAGVTTKPAEPTPGQLRQPGPLRQGGATAHAAQPAHPAHPGEVGELPPFRPVSTAAGTEPAVTAPGGHQLQPPKSDRDDRPALFGWYPDVTGRHEKRYFDGRRWHELVADAGVISTDPL
ncbi:MAG TPA: DUF2510 domain-containing protein [Acidimicrobiales bacterium]|nr:DUF2510 domain-containing protein [Acidimicrobiales bacterium]